nr:MAG TPA: Protein involved in gliding motility 9 Secretion System Type.5A [Caudoviricetes sp.]
MKRIAILAAVAALLMSCRGKSPSFEKTPEYAAFSSSLVLLESRRDSLFNLSESLPAGTNDDEVLRLMEERSTVEAEIRRVKADRDEAERVYYLKQAGKR